MEQPGGQGVGRRVPLGSLAKGGLPGKGEPPEEGAPPEEGEGGLARATSRPARTQPNGGTCK